MADKEHPFEKVGRSSDYIARMGARSNVTFEEGKVQNLLKQFKISKDAVREIREFAADATGHPDLTFAAFNRRFESFPLLLGASRLDGVQLHLAQTAMIPALFKTFGKAPFVDVFDAFYETNQPRANGRPVGMVFPRKGFKQGMVIYATDDPKEIPLCERETMLAYVSGKGKKQHWLVVRSYQKLLEALHNGGHGWRPE